MNQKEFIDILVDNNIVTGSGIYDSFLSNIIEEATNRNDFEYFSAHSEPESIGICSAVKSCGVGSCVFIPNSSIWKMGGIITSFSMLKEIPILYIISWKGDLKNDQSSENVINGYLMHTLLDSLNIFYTYAKDRKKVEYAIKIMNEDNRSVAIIVSKDDINDS